MPSVHARPQLDVPGASRQTGAISLRDQVLLIWRYRVAIVAAALAFALAGALWSVLQPRRYEAVATLSVNAARLAEQTQPSVSPESFVPLLRSPALATALIAEFELGEPPHEYSASDLESVVTVRAVPSSSLIKVVALLDDPALASRVANRYAELGIEATRRASRVDVDALERELKAMLDEASERRAAAERAYEEYRTTAQVEMVAKEVETLLQQRAELMGVTVALEAERAGLARLEAELSRREPLTALRQSVVEDPALAEAARGASTSTKDLLGLEMRREIQNPAFFNLDEQAATSRAKVAAMERQVARLAAAAGLSGAELGRLNQLYERQAELERLSTELKLATTAYADVAAKYMGARLAAVGRTPQLTVVDPAIAPDAPVSRALARNVALGLSVGGLLACAFIMARQALAAA